MSSRNSSMTILTSATTAMGCCAANSFTTVLPPRAKIGSSCRYGLRLPLVNCVSCAGIDGAFGTARTATWPFAGDRRDAPIPRRRRSDWPRKRHILRRAAGFRRRPLPACAGESAGRSRGARAGARECAECRNPSAGPCSRRPCAPSALRRRCWSWCRLFRRRRAREARRRPTRAVSVRNRSCTTSRSSLPRRSPPAVCEALSRDRCRRPTAPSACRLGRVEHAAAASRPRVALSEAPQSRP